MAEQQTDLEVGIQKMPNPLITGIQTRPTPAPPSIASPPVEQNREFVWFILGAMAGAITGAVQEESTGDLMRDIAPAAIVGAVLGIVGGFQGEKWRAGRVGRKLVLFWAIYWLLFWVMIPVVVGVALYLWIAARFVLHGMMPPLVGFGSGNSIARLVLVLTPYAVLGAIFGAVGGVFRAFRLRLRVRFGRGRIQFMWDIKPRLVPRTDAPSDPG